MPVVEPCTVPVCTRLQEERRKLSRFRNDAVIASAAYDPMGARTPPPGYREITNAAELAQVGLTPEELTPPASEFRAAVFQHQDGSYVVAFKGTSPTSLEDWKNNRQQAFAEKSEYYSQAQLIAKRMGVSGAKVRYTGHSLGGGLASAAAKAAGADATTFNAAGLNAQTVLEPRSGGHIDAVYVRGDLLTSVQHGPLA